MAVVDKRARRQRVARCGGDDERNEWQGISTMEAV